MHFASLLLPVLAVASAIPADLVPRQSQDLTTQILQNLTVARTDNIRYNDSLNTQPTGNTPYTGAQSLTSFQRIRLVSTDFNSTAGTANRSAILSQANSKQVYDNLSGQLRPAIVSVLDNSVAHTPNFKASGTTTAIRNLLSQQREFARELSNTSIARVVAPYKAQTTTLRDSILASYDSAISRIV